MSVLVVDTVTPDLICLGFHLLATGNIIPEQVFPSLALSVHLQIALYTAMRRHALKEEFYEAVKRVEDFLLQPEFKDARMVTDLGQVAVKCIGVAISLEGCEEPILRNINFSVSKGTITACIGISSSGKSTFLQGLAGEARIVEGSLRVDSAEIAYCDQNPSLGDVSIREIIIAGLEFDSQRYDLVLRLCLLHHDIQRLDEGDAYAVGADGVNLSGGQRHRVVSITFSSHIHRPLLTESKVIGTCSILSGSNCRHRRSI